MSSDKREELSEPKEEGREGGTEEGERESGREVEGRREEEEDARSMTSAYGGSALECQ